MNMWVTDGFSVTFHLFIYLFFFLGLDLFFLIDLFECYRKAFIKYLNACGLRMGGKSYE